MSLAETSEHAEHAHDALRELRQQAVDAAANAFLITDVRQPDNPIVDANPAFITMTGYARDTILGRNCRFLQGPGTDPTMVAHLGKAIRAEQSVTVTLLNYRQDRSPFWNELTISPLRDRNGQVTHYVGVQNDVTARIRATELEIALAAEREVSRLTTEFLHIISHELRSPLTTILGFAEMLLDPRAEPLSAAQASDVQHIDRSGQRLLRLVNELIDLSQIQGGSALLNKEEVSLGALVAHVQEELRSLATQKGLTLTVDISARLPLLSADPQRLEQVIRHLLDNAIRFTAAGTVAVTASPVPDGIAITVADTGVGIAPEVLPHLFTPFRQGDSGMTRSQGGVGLGLALVKWLVDLHGGTIAVESTLGVGSLVTVIFPLSS